MSGIMQVELYDMSMSVFDLIDTMEQSAKMLRVTRQTGDFAVIDWEIMRDRVDSAFNIVFDNLQLNEEDEVLDEIEGEEELDTELHPLDDGDDDEDDTWYEGFDDV